MYGKINSQLLYSVFSSVVLYQSDAISSFQETIFNFFIMECQPLHNYYFTIPIKSGCYSSAVYTRVKGFFHKQKARNILWQEGLKYNELKINDSCLI